MNDKMKQFGENIKFRWQDLNTIKRVILVLGILSIIVVSGSVFYLINRTEYGVLFSNLSEQDAGTITKDLQEQNIEYKLSDNGKEILIEQDKIDEYRISLAVDNKLPNSTTGFELFDNADLMTTDEDRKIMYQRAVTGELQRAIESLSAVSKAKVLLVMPDNSIFSEKSSDSTASVVLTLKNNSISEETVQGIVNLVSGAVENLTPENIKVVDSNGRTLTTNIDGSGQVSTMSNQYIEIKKNYENDLENKLSAILQQVYGAGNYQLSINLDMNFDSTESTKITYGDTAVRSESVQANGSQADVQQAQNGTIEDNVTNVTGDTEDGSKSYDHSVNNEVDQETVKTINAPSSIRRLTSSVVIGKSLSLEEQENLKNIIQSAIGYNEARGDVLSIQGMDFSEKTSTKNDSIGDDKEENEAAVKRYLPYLVIMSIVIILLITGVVGSFLFRRRPKNREFDDYEEDNFIKDEESENTTSDGASALERDYTEEKKVESILGTTGENIEEKRIKEFADRNPEAAAELIKAWLKKNS
ncbi:flagellar basal-body MS-ring/collar protein FliF [Enterococcus italicus]|uniref:flagellar basal-body MS-ring/collar protein FliF n=1 Tax=Enterococcus italicus TaxID=246144 RepID=UPI0028A94FE8|nr:flagellar basal-body MS-ring/collar protein FliF [Enterococcus italicus]